MEELTVGSGEDLNGITAASVATSGPFGALDPERAQFDVDIFECGAGDPAGGLRVDANFREIRSIV